MRQILILIIFLLINTNTLANKKFEYADEEKKEKDLVNYSGKLF